MSTSSRSGLEVHPFFVNRNSKPTLHPQDDLAKQASSAMSTDAGFDQNEDRRKRQRTASSERLFVKTEDSDPNENENKWADQLRTVTFSGKRVSAIIVSPTIREHETNNQYRTDITSDGPSIMTQLQNETSSASPQVIANGPTIAGPIRDSNTPISHEEIVAPPPRKKLRVRPDGKLASPKAQKIDQETTPPKKVLRIRSDGKLGSPKGMGDLQDSKPKRTRKSTKSNTSPKKFVVTVKYGHGDGSRSTIACKVDDILSGRITRSSPKRTESTAPAELPKATHPFFLGASSRVLARRSSVSCNSREGEADASPPPRRKYVSPKKAGVISKPADVAPQSIGRNTLGWSTFGTDHARVPRFPGAVEPIWPPQDMLHVGRNTSSLELDRIHQGAWVAPIAYRKLKGVEVKVPAEEEVLTPCLDLVRKYRDDDTIFREVTVRDWRQFRRPLRRLMTNAEMQKAVRQELSSNTIDSNLDLGEIQLHDELGTSPTPQQATHSAVNRMYNNIATSRTAFDNFECETQEWIHKYAPTTAEEVLQQSREVLLLRDWLKGLTVNSVEDRSGGTRESSISRKLNSKPAKKKRKRAKELGDFLVSSDEDTHGTNGADDITGANDPLSASTIFKRSLSRRENGVESSDTLDRAANAVVISGPHGSGKTAAVYAVARELGFEVFEINAGSRRSGKDILDKVGDMTRNHLVQNVPGEEPARIKGESGESELVSETLNNEIRNGRQGTVNSFFTVKGKPKRPSTGDKAKDAKVSPRKSKDLQKHKSQKQSLILLEEVDVLFEEDKMFWSTTLNLIIQSKRPVILTATDERLLPLGDMILFAILRFTPPPTEIAIDYLVIIACNEGHLLSRSAVSTLYRAKQSDLRASIMELNFFCQMAIGDTKGGLDWMLLSSTADGLPCHKSHSKRVVSEGTYQTAMGFLSGEESRSFSQLSLDEETKSLLEIWNSWGIDIEASESFISMVASATDANCSQKVDLEVLQDYDQAAEALSAADTFPAVVCHESNLDLLETHVPELTDQMRSNYTEGSGLLLADYLVDQSGVTESLALALRVCARHLSHHPYYNNSDRALDKQWMIELVPEIMKRRLDAERSKKVFGSTAFDPIARSSNPVLGTPKGPQISCFDSPISVIVEDLAPYVRSIVSYDLKLEEHRRQLSSLLLGPGKDGRKVRTTRSSRAALEGGQKAHTRREKWFPNDTNFDLILQSGGLGWQDALQRIMTDGSEGYVETDPSGMPSDGSAMQNGF